MLETKFDSYYICEKLESNWITRSFVYLWQLPQCCYRIYIIIASWAKFEDDCVWTDFLFWILDHHCWLYCVDCCLNVVFYKFFILFVSFLWLFDRWYPAGYHYFSPIFGACFVYYPGLAHPLGAYCNALGLYAWNFSCEMMPIVIQIWFPRR